MVLTFLKLKGFVSPFQAVHRMKKRKLVHDEWTRIRSLSRVQSLSSVGVPSQDMASLKRKEDSTHQTEHLLKSSPGVELSEGIGVRYPK